MAILRRIVNRLKSVNYRGMIKKFADRAGLIYFGYIDPSSDGHKPIKGFTVSVSHTDNHQCIGTINGYDVNIIHRNDVDTHGRTHLVCDWLIMTIDLHTDHPIPHFLIGANNQDMRAFEHLFSSFPNMHPIDICENEKIADDEFRTRFKVYARPAKSSDIESLFTIDARRYVSAHLWPLSVEQHDNVLYIYALNENIHPRVLDAMLENGLWLAAHLDRNAGSSED